MAAAVNQPDIEYDCQLATTNGGGNCKIETQKRGKSRYDRAFRFASAICCLFLDHFMLLVSFYTACLMFQQV